MIFTVTDQAANQIDRLKKNKDHALRIRIVGGGCSGMSYKFEFTDSINSETDFFVKKGSSTVVLDQKSALYLMGSKLDYNDTLTGAGFKINNPNATNTCGCGESLEYNSMIRTFVEYVVTTEAPQSGLTRDSRAGASREGGFGSKDQITQDYRKKRLGPEPTITD